VLPSFRRSELRKWSLTPVDWLAYSEAVGPRFAYPSTDHWSEQFPGLTRTGLRRDQSSAMYVPDVIAPLKREHAPVIERNNEIDRHIVGGKVADSERGNCERHDVPPSAWLQCVGTSQIHQDNAERCAPSFVCCSTFSTAGRGHQLPNEIQSAPSDPLPASRDDPRRA
jgi:hypothetical protein